MFTFFYRNRKTASYVTHIGESVVANCSLTPDVLSAKHV